MDKAKRRLTNISFEKEGCHVALVHKDQGGAANGYTTLTLKATDDIEDSAVTEQLEAVEKAKYYQELRNTLEEALRDHFEESLEYNWLYLEDFNDTQVVFSTDGKMYTAGYSLGENDKYVFDPVAKEVDIKRVYELTPDGEILLSEDVLKEVESGIRELLTKSLENTDTVNRASTLLKSTLEKEKTKMDEIQKAVAEAEKVLKAQIEEMQSKLEAYATAEKESKLALRKSALAEVVAEDQIEGILKNAEALSEEAFASIVATMKSLKAPAVDQDLMVQKSGEGDVVAPEQTTAALLKARFPQAQA